MTQALWPQLTLASGLLFCLAAGLVREVSSGALRLVAVAALIAAAWGVAPRAGPGLAGADGIAVAWQFVLYAGALPLVLILDEDDEIPIALVLACALGMGLMAVSRDLLLLFVGLELTSLPAVLLSARLRDSKSPPYEAAVKYFFASGAASSLFLMGLALHYAAGRTLDLAPAAGPAGAAGLALMGSAVLLKAGAVPLHFWLPDVYESSRPSLAAFLSTAVKAAAVLALMRLAAMAPEGSLARGLPAIGSLSALYGALQALRQQNLARLLAYSSISHAGILILGVGAWAAQGADPAAAAPLFFYVLAYLFMSTGAFFFLEVSGLKDRAALRGYFRRHPAEAALFAVLLLSLAGMPPTGGFLAKFLIFWEAVKTQLWLPLAAGALAALVAVGYYMDLARAMILDEPKGGAPEPSRGIDATVLWICAAASAVLGLAPWVLTVAMRAWS